MKQKETYISLKDASEISGYSADYIGQLIRSGKLPGKQVFQQVVWMTTEENVREYMHSKKGNAAARSGWFGSSKAAKRVEAPRLITHLLYGAAGLCVFLFLFLFYVLSSSLDNSMNQNAIDNLEATSTL